jgi:hypothetical protein
MPVVQKNSICATKGGRPKEDRPKPVSWRPKSKAARDKYLQLGGARWLNRILEGMV